MERAAGAWLALDPEPPAHQAHQRRRDGQAEAGAAEPPRRRSVRLAERLEDSLVFPGRDTDARVGDAELQPRAAFDAGDFADGDEDVAVFGELDGVGDEVGQHLLNPRRVADHAGRDLRADVALEREALLVRSEGERLEQLRRPRAERERDRLELELARFNLREVEDVVQISSVSADVRTVARLSLLNGELAVEHGSVMPMMPFIGVRISWLMLARNSLFAQLASIAPSRAASVPVARLELGGARYGVRGRPGWTLRIALLDVATSG
jgi:hypothetical protein